MAKMAKMKMMSMDGNMALAHVSYAFTETAAIYPITPSSNMAEYTDEWAAAGKKNIFGETVDVVEMQSEAGAAGAVHGSLQAGALTTTYTASQGLLLMIPNMYKISGELLPGVFHVSARTVAAHALSIFGDHSDVYAARQTGFAMLAAGSVQEVMDLGAVAHLAAIKSRVPFLHFFDGFRTSHEVQKIEAWDYDDLGKLVDWDALDRFRNDSMNPDNPVTRGTAQNPDIFFQAKEACNPYYEAVTGIVEDYMKEISKLTGRDYKLFNYYGAPDAEHIVIAMGSATDTIQETIDYLVEKGEKVGAILVRLYRPFSIKHFLGAIPASTKKITVLDRTKEPGAPGEPLYLDVKSALYEQENSPVVIGGRYGLSSKDVTPNQIIAVFDNSKLSEPKNLFTVGIVDDVTNTSLTVGPQVKTSPEGMVACKFFGLGADGTVGANKNSIKIIGDNTDMYTQGYFAYDSKKSGGVTVSHLRFGKEPIRSTYLVNHPDFISCSELSYLDKYDMLKGIKKGGTFLLNSIWDEKEVVENLPDRMKKQLAENEVNFYIVNATKLAVEIGLGHRTNTIMQSAFFKLSEVIPYSDAVDYMKTAIEKTYGRKGKDIVDMNNAAVDQGSNGLVKVNIPKDWKNIEVGKVEYRTYGITEKTDKALSDFVQNIAAPVNALDGDLLPVSAFKDAPDGTLPCGSSAFEKRGIGVNVPEWVHENCIQCHQCSYVCPHAAIRPFLLDENELKNAPEGLNTIKPMGKGMDDYKHRIQVSVLDCTGCGVCADVCPAKKKALIMKTKGSQEDNIQNWDYCANNVSYKETPVKKFTVKGSQFFQPLFEFSGACAGCGETPYVKIITQMFGDRMMIANATGCSSIYGGSAPSTPFCKNAEGKGPTWANSLFEDNAEYAEGMVIAVDKLRERIAIKMKEALNSVSGELKEAFSKWLEGMNDGEASKEVTKTLIPLLEKDSSEVAKEILKLKQYLIKRSVWAMGGDGWAYDIGYGGVDHVLASGKDVNILVMDTEVYSNTGGQSSKASPTGAVAKFAASGKTIRKKDLGRMAMTYGYVYVAQVALGANQTHFLKALQEAESYPGPALIIAYSPCVAHGIKKGGMTKSQAEQKLAVESGYWHLFRYNPMLEQDGKNPFVLDSKKPDLEKYIDFIKSEVRYATLMGSDPEGAEKLFAQAKEEAKWRYDNYRRMSEMDYSN